MSSASPLLETTLCALYDASSDGKLLHAGLASSRLAGCTTSSTAVPVPPSLCAPVAHARVIPIDAVACVQGTRYVASALVSPFAGAKLMRLSSHLRAHGPFSNARAVAHAHAVLSVLDFLELNGQRHAGELSVDHLMIDSTSGDIFVIPVVGARRAKKDAISRAAAHCLYVLYTGFARPRGCAKSAVLEEDGRSFSFPDSVPEHARQVMNSLLRGSEVSEVMKHPLFATLQEENYQQKPESETLKAEMNEDPLDLPRTSPLSSTASSSPPRAPSPPRVRPASTRATPSPPRRPQPPVKEAPAPAPSADSCTVKPSSIPSRPAPVTEKRLNGTRNVAARAKSSMAESNRVSGAVSSPQDLSPLPLPAPPSQKNRDGPAREALGYNSSSDRMSAFTSTSSSTSSDGSSSQRVDRPVREELRIGDRPRDSARLCSVLSSSSAVSSVSGSPGTPHARQPSPGPADLAGSKVPDRDRRATTSDRPYGAARLMDPEAFRPVREWKGRLETLERSASMTAKAAARNDKVPRSASSRSAAGEEGPEKIDADQAAVAYVRSKGIDDGLAFLVGRFRNPSTGVQVTSRKVGILRRLKPCFNGAEATAWIAGFKRTGRAQAVTIAQVLLDRSVIRSVHAAPGSSPVGEKFYDDAQHLYVFVDPPAESDASAPVESAPSADYDRSKTGSNDSPAGSLARVQSSVTSEHDSHSGMLGSERSSGASGSDRSSVSAAQWISTPGSNQIVLNSAKPSMNGLAAQLDHDPVRVVDALLRRLLQLCEDFAVSEQRRAVGTTAPHGSGPALNAVDAASRDRGVARSLAEQGRQLPGVGIGERDGKRRGQALSLDLSSLKSSATFAQFQEDLSQLQSVDLGAIVSRVAKACFAVNLYNLLSLHTRILSWSASGRYERPKLQRSHAYLVGPTTMFSQDDIANNMLRTEKRGRIMRLVQGSARSLDAERQRELAVYPVMPELLCAICSTNTSYDPPIRVYTTANLHVELREVVDEFLCTWVRVRPTPSNTLALRLPKVFSQWREDFGNDDALRLSTKRARACVDDRVTANVIAWVSSHIPSNETLADHVLDCQGLEFYRSADAFEDNRGGSEFAPLLWRS